MNAAADHGGSMLVRARLRLCQNRFRRIGVCKKAADEPVIQRTQALHMRLGPLGSTGLPR